MKKDVMKNELRKFGIIFGIALIAIGIVQLLKGHTKIYPWFYGIGLISLILGIFAPSAIKPIYFIFKKIGSFIGNIVTGLILAIVFYIVLTPIALIARLFGKDFLDIKWKKKSNTYWMPKEVVKDGVERYERQY